MSKTLPKRYLTETAVKKALKIDSFRNMSKDKIMQFASMIPYMDKDVAIAIINQFPKFADFGKTLIENYTKLCDNILEKNHESQMAAIHGYQTILDANAKKLEKDEITEEERKSITEDMIVVADKIAELDFQNKKFYERMGSKALFAVVAVAGLVGAAIGVSSAIGNSSGELPEVDDDSKHDDE